MMSPEMTGAPATEQSRRPRSACSTRCSRRGKIEREAGDRLDARLTVSDREVLQKKDFAQMSAAEIAAAKDAIKRLVLGFEAVKTRRLAPHIATPSHRSPPHLARQHEGRRRVDRPEIPRAENEEPPIVALLDISGSMSQYTRLFLHFLHAVTDARKRDPRFCSARG